MGSFFFSDQIWSDPFFSRWYHSLQQSDLRSFLGDQIFLSTCFRSDLDFSSVPCSRQIKTTTMIMMMNKKVGWSRGQQLQDHASRRSFVRAGRRIRQKYPGTEEAMEAWNGELPAGRWKEGRWRSWKKKACGHGWSGRIGEKRVCLTGGKKKNQTPMVKHSRTRTRTRTRTRRRCDWPPWITCRASFFSVCELSEVWARSRVGGVMTWLSIAGLGERTYSEKEEKRVMVELRFEPWPI